MKTILLIGAGKSATVLINYLLDEAEKNGWKFIIADADKEHGARQRPITAVLLRVVELDITNEREREKLDTESPCCDFHDATPPYIFLMAKDCVEYRKHLLTASYLDDKIKSLRDEINQRKLFFLCEMGLDPGIDHMSAMKIIHAIEDQRR